MAMSIKELAQDKKLQAQGIIDKLDLIKADANKFVKDLVVLEAAIDLADSFDDLHESVDDIISLDDAVGKLLSREPDVIHVIRERIKNNPGSGDIANLLDFLSDYSKISNKVSGAKERLLERELYEHLSEAEKSVAKNFIDDVKGLKSVSENLEHQKNEFRIRLNGAVTPDQVTEIEDEISRRDKDYNNLLVARMRYPENKQTAGLLIDFMNSNHHLKAILQSFAFEESLTDDVLHARGRVFSSSASTSFR